MARKETVIPEKVIKSRVKVEVTCDCCGDRTDDLDVQNISYIELDLLGHEYVVPENVSTTDDLLTFCLAQENT